MILDSCEAAYANVGQRGESDNIAKTSYLSQDCLFGNKGPVGTATRLPMLRLVLPSFRRKYFWFLAEQWRQRMSVRFFNLCFCLALLLTAYLSVLTNHKFELGPLWRGVLSRIIIISQSGHSFHRTLCGSKNLLAHGSSPGLDVKRLLCSKRSLISAGKITYLHIGRTRAPNEFSSTGSC